MPIFYFLSNGVRYRTSINYKGPTLAWCDFVLQTNSIATIADWDGKFALTVYADSVPNLLTISYVGYTTQGIALFDENGNLIQSAFKVTLQEPPAIIEHLAYSYPKISLGYEGGFSYLPYGLYLNKVLRQRRQETINTTIVLKTDFNQNYHFRSTIIFGNLWYHRGRTLSGTATWAQQKIFLNDKM